MPSIIKIHGFLHEDRSADPEFGNISVDEVVLIETDSATTSVVQLLGLLPATASPSSSNPLGISFTFNVSTHPESSNLVLREAGTIKQVAGAAGNWWLVPLTYKIEEYSTVEAGQSPNPRNRKDQIVVVPALRPPVWNSSTQLVLKETYTDADGDPIVHANGLPITEPYRYEEVHEIHTFAFNIAYADFSYNTDIRPYKGAVSSANVFGQTAQDVKLVNLSCSEEYESAGTGVSRTEYRYIRVTAQFEFNPSGWVNDAKIISRSTLQLVAGELYPIDINGRGDKATEPWPLLADGTAAQYDDLDPTQFATIDTGYPSTANLSTFASAYGLAIP